MAEEPKTIADLSAKITRLEAEKAEAQGIITELQNQLEAKANQAATGNFTFLAGAKTYEIALKRFRLSFEHTENGRTIEKGSVLQASELEKLPNLVTKLIEKKLGGLSELSDKTPKKGGK